MTKERIFGLDVMRAVAVLLVLISRLKRIVPDSEIRHIASVGGVIGVEIFFVLSGFLIGSIVLSFFLKDDFNFLKVKNFWIRRFFRILPNYFLILITNILVFKLIGFSLPESIWKYFFFIHNFANALPVFFMESWSLSVEEFSYILLPLSLFLIIYFSKKTNKMVIFKYTAITAIIFFFVTKLVYNYYNNNTDLNYWALHLRTIVIYRIDSIFYGVLAAYFYYAYTKIWTKYANTLLVLGFIIIIGLHLLIFIKKPFFASNMLFWNVFYFPLNSLAIALTLPFLSTLKTAPKFILKPITFISLISYSIYLLHNLIIYICVIYFPVNKLTAIQLIGYFTMYCAFTISLSAIIYKFYEKPIMDFRDSVFFIDNSKI